MFPCFLLLYPPSLPQCSYSASLLPPHSSPSLAIFFFLVCPLRSVACYPKFSFPSPTPMLMLLFLLASSNFSSYTSSFSSCCLFSMFVCFHLLSLPLCVLCYFHYNLSPASRPVAYSSLFAVSKFSLPRSPLPFILIFFYNLLRIILLLFLSTYSFCNLPLITLLFFFFSFLLSEYLFRYVFIHSNLPQ